MQQDFYSKTLSQNLREIRRRKGLTTTDVARILGVSQAKISYIEHGRGVLSARDVAVLSRRLDIPVTEFYLGLDKAEASSGQNELANQLAYFGAKFLAKPAGVQLSSPPFEEVIGEALSFIEDDRLHKAFCAALIIQAATSELNVDRVFALIGNNPFLVSRIAEESQICLQLIATLNRETNLVPARAKRQLERIRDLALSLAGDKIKNRPLSPGEILDLASFVGECLRAER
jgi:transcriptional regulator with XRE-family HTH domain